MICSLSTLNSFFSIRPTDQISGNAFDDKRKKKGMALKTEKKKKKKDFICFGSHPDELNNCSVKTDSKLLSVLRTEQTHFPQ